MKVLPLWKLCKYAIFFFKARVVENYMSYERLLFLGYAPSVLHQAPVSLYSSEALRCLLGTLCSAGRASRTIDQTRQRGEVPRVEGPVWFRSGKFRKGPKGPLWSGQIEVYSPEFFFSSVGAGGLIGRPSHLFGTTTHVWEFN